MASTITEPLATTMDEPLARLVAFEPTTFPVLSVYLNSQSDQHGRTPDAVPYLHREFKALARTWAPSSPERHSGENCLLCHRQNRSRGKRGRHIRVLGRGRILRGNPVNDSCK